jgi:hypothetical protein
MDTDALVVPQLGTATEAEAVPEGIPATTDGGDSGASDDTSAAFSPSLNKALPLEETENAPNHDDGAVEAALGDADSLAAASTPAATTEAERILTSAAAPSASEQATGPLPEHSSDTSHPTGGPAAAPVVEEECPNPAGDPEAKPEPTEDDDSTTIAADGQQGEQADPSVISASMDTSIVDEMASEGGSPAPNSPGFTPGAGRVTNQLQYLNKFVLPTLTRVKISWPFRVPVDWKKLNLPVCPFAPRLRTRRSCLAPTRGCFQTYPDVVKNPMDLGTVRKKLQKREYNSAAECIADIDLIWSNCQLFNRPGDVRHCQLAQLCTAAGFRLLSVSSPRPT